MFTPQNFSGNQALTQMFLSRQDEHVSFISPCLHFQVVQGFKRQYSNHDFASSATMLLLQPNGVQWNIYTYMSCTRIPQPVLLKYRNLHLHIWCFFFHYIQLQTSSHVWPFWMKWVTLKHCQRLEACRELPLGAAVRNQHQPSSLTKAAFPADFSLLPPYSALRYLCLQVTSGSGLIGHCSL